MGYFAFYLYTFFLLIRPQDWWGPLLNAPVVTVFLAIAILSVLLDREKYIKYPQYALAIVLIIQAALSSAANGWLGGAVGTVQILLTGLFLPMLCAGVLIKDRFQREKIFKLMIWSALFMAFNGIVQRTSSDGMGLIGEIPLQRDRRIFYAGIFNDPNDLGMFFVMVLPIIGYFFIQSRNFSRYLYLLAAFIILIGIYFTNSRGTLLAVFALIGVWHFFNQGLVKTMWRVGLAAPVLLFIMSKFREIDATEASAEGRLDAWYAGMQMFLSHPIFGVGQGNFVEHHDLAAHNSFVQIFSELGIPGYYCWVGIIFLTMIPFWYLLQQKKDSPELIKEDNPLADISVAVSRVGVSSAEHEQAVILHGKTLFYSMIAYLCTAFFLSRSYTMLLYLFVGVCISCVEELRRFGYINLPPRFNRYMFIIAGFVFISITTVWLVTKVFL